MLNITEFSGMENELLALERLEKECFLQDSWSLSSLRSNINNKNTIYIVAYDCKEIVGYLSASVVCDEGELNRICVLASHRSKGIGNKLVQHLILHLKSKSCLKIMLEVRSQNQNAISLYKKNGFKVDYTRKNYYQNPVDDALLMTYTF